MASVKYILLIVFYIFIHYIIEGQVVRIEAPRIERMSLSGKIHTFNTRYSLSAEQALDSIKHSTKTKHGDKNLTPGFSSDFYWIYFEIENKHSDLHNFNIEINNPHIDTIKFFEGTQQMKLACVTGDRTPFYSRQLDNRRFVFETEIEFQSKKSYLILIDKRNAAVSFPIYFWDNKSFKMTERIHQFAYFLFFGGTLFIFFFALIVGSLTKNYRMLSYSFYVLTMSLYLFTALGFAFRFLYPESDSLNNYFRTQILVVAIAAFFLFSSLFIKMNEQMPKLHKVILTIIIFLLGLVALSVIFKDYFFRNIVIYLNIIYIVAIITIPLFVYSAIRTYKSERNLILSYLIAVSALFIGGVLNTLIEYGLINESKLPLNPILMASVVELFIFSLAFILEIKSINDKKNSLLEAKNRHQQQLMSEYLRGTEEEGSRISKELHDNIGSRLSILKSQVEMNLPENETIKQQISDIFKDVRAISKTISPDEVKIHGISSAVQHLLENFSSATGIKVNFYNDLKSELANSIEIQLFKIIQEILQNALKHSQAKIIDCQIVEYNKVVTLIISDDGVGFDIAHTETKLGFGLKNLKFRAESIGAEIHIDSTPGHGTNYIIILKLD